MAPIKRKAITDERPSKKTKAAKPAEDGSAPKAKKKAPDADSSERKPAAKSVLQQEDRAFPRGGASVLTPIEHKQIKVQAEQDVLFEQQQPGRSKRDGNEDEDLFGGESKEGPARKKQQKKRKQDKESSDKPESSGIKIQGLSYKNAVVGTVVLGHVTAITSRDIALSLANNLTGYVPITAVSERLNGRIEKLLENEGRDGAPEEEEEDVDLKDMFHIGQWLRATVTATGTDASDGAHKSRRHIELSIDPRQANAGLSPDQVVVHSMIQASVRSVEDHGLVMDLGLSDSSVKGFASKKEIGASYKMDDVQEGQVMMCLVTGKGSNGQVLKLSPDAARFSAMVSGKGAPTVSEAPTVDGFQPGTAVEVLVSEVGSGGVVGKVMGMLDVTAEVVHSGASVHKDDLNKKVKVGSKAKGRIIWTTPSEEGSRRVAISLLDHLLNLPPPPTRLPENASGKLRTQATELEQHLPLSSTVSDAKITHVLTDRGVFLDLPSSEESENSFKAFAHISQVADSRIDTLSTSSGSFRIDSQHKARIMSYNPVDNLYYVSLKPSVLDQAFLRVEDLNVGELVQGKVERLIIGPRGVSGILVKLSDKITGLVPEMHLSDVQLQHPERKFKEGFPVKARILSVDLEKRHTRLTLKKTLVNEDHTAFKAYEKLEPGMEGKGTIINLLPNGAVVQFFGDIRAWLPVAEMSDAFVEKPDQHFRLGQTVSVRILSVNAAEKEMKVSCRDPRLHDSAQQASWEKVTAGQFTSGTVVEKTADAVMLDLEGGIRGTVRIGHLADGSEAKAESALKKVHIGQKMSDLLVLEKLERSRHILLTKKASMIKDASADALVCSSVDASQGKQVHGFVRNVTPEGVYVEFANGTVGLLPKSQVAPELLSQPAFGLTKDRSVSAWVMSVDPSRQRFALSMREKKEETPSPALRQPSALSASLSNAVDASAKTVADFALGRVTKARIASIKGTQINVRLADNVQGRIDASEVFDSWDEITNKRAPLQKFKQHEVLDVKILGIHDSRNHRFLPISHRQSSVAVFELSAKRSRVVDGNENGLSTEAVKVGSQELAFVNNHGNHCVWVNISPNVRGRIAAMDLSSDAGQLQNLERSFPIGCALRVTVKSVDASENRLDLVNEAARTEEPLTLETVAPGMVLAGRITKVSERSVNVQLSEGLAAPVPLIEIGDDYDQLNLGSYTKNDIVRVSVLEVDRPNKRVFLSMRPSKVLSSSLPVRDPSIATYEQVKVGDILRGYVKHVAEKGVYVSIGARVDAFVRISDLSDKFVKDWKTIVEVDQLVKGRVLAVDAKTKHAMMSLKSSHIDVDFKPPVTISDLEPGQIVTGKVRKVEDFGAFIDIDNTHPRLSGLCHRSEVAEKRIEDVSKIYSAGDVVKAKVLSVDIEARKISLGLKASYFTDRSGDDEDASDDESDSDGGIEVDGEADDDEDEDMEGGVDLGNVKDMESDAEDSSDADEMDVDDEKPKPSAGLRTSGFDWTGDTLGPTANGGASDSEPDTAASKKRRRRKPEIKEDLTGDLDKFGPRSASDFERQLLGQPNNSSLWLQYMAFHLQLSEQQKARETAQRALRTIHIRDLDEKANIWIAWLNLEVEYGTDDSVDDVFREACQVQDPLEMHNKLASIYIDSGRQPRAEAIFDRIVANKSFRASPDVWLNYAHFLMDKLAAPDRARALLSRALQSVPSHEHRLLTAKFAALEFHSTNGDEERGRTIFEGLLAEWPKWSSGWDMLVDLERARIAHAEGKQAVAEAKGKVRALFERMVAGKMKKRRARFVFKKWLEFEAKEGDAKTAERVKKLAQE